MNILKPYTHFLRLMDRKRRAEAIFATVLMALSALLAYVIEPLILERLYGAFIDASPGNNNGLTVSHKANSVIRIEFYILISVLVGNQILKRLYEFVVVKHQNQMAEIVYSLTSRTLLQKDYSFFRTIGETGSLQSKDDRYCIAYFEMQNIFNIIFLPSLITVVGMIVVLSIKVPIMGLVTGIWLSVYIFVLYFLLTRKYKLDRLESQANSKLKSYFQDLFANIYSVLHSGMRKSEHYRYVLKLKEYLSVRLKTAVRNVHLNTFQGAMSVALIIVLIAFLIPIFRRGQVTVTEIILVTLYTTRLTQNFWNVGNGIVSVVKHRAYMEEMIILLEHPAKVVFPSSSKRSELAQVHTYSHAVEFRKVTFTHDTNDAEFANNLFEKFDFLVKRGQRLAIVGTTGGGKSTLAQLLLRQIDPTNGSILVNGINLKDYTEEELTRCLMHMPQEPTFFNDTIAENIRRYVNESISNETLYESLKSVDLHDFIYVLKDGVDTVIGERGMRLSGGQKQRLALARVFAKVLTYKQTGWKYGEPILILDEPTSALDQETERKIKSALDELHRNYPALTIIVIAHRLVSIRDFDKIVVLKRGVVVESGSHSELIALNGEYSCLWEKQPLLQEENS